MCIDDGKSEKSVVCRKYDGVSMEMEIMKIMAVGRLRFGHVRRREESTKMY